ncbi:MAG: ABC transporter ATP-binding protein, partial [Dehalococcoidia bacterium]|nr:ABC transporter ATP-binding protein [Dehalococcoidia bacterium]
VIYVTHDQVEAMTMADRIVLVKDGVIQQVDHPQAIYEAPANIFVAEFMGSPGMNFFKARLTSQDGELSIDAGFFKIRLQGRPKDVQEQDVMLGVRPEDIIEVRHPEAGSASGYFHSRVDLAEPLGSEKLLHLVSRDISFVARVDPRSPAQSGDDITLAINTERVRLFDARTGNAILVAAGETNNGTGELG